MEKNTRNDCESDNVGHRERVFRISVSLKQFFQDECALVCMQVSSAQSVRCLRRRLRRSFRLPRALRLLSRGHLLPPGEPLAVLDQDDLVEVVAAPRHAPCSEGSADSEHIDDSEIVEQPTPTTPATDQTPPVHPANPVDPANPVHFLLKDYSQDELLQRKRLANQILDKFFADKCKEAELQSEGCVARRSTRRRVRRRRRTALPCISNELGENENVSLAPTVKDEDNNVCTPDVKVDTMKVDETDWSRAVDTDISVVGVLRNVSPARPARVVRPLAFGLIV